MVNRFGVRVISVFACGAERRAHSHHVMELLGLKAGGHLPVEGMAERLIDGVRVYVAPVVTGDRRVRGHRVMAICECGRHIPVGRLHQHKCRCGCGGPKDHLGACENWMSEKGGR